MDDEILVLQHVDCEPPGAYGAELSAVAGLRTVRMGVDTLPESTEFAAIVAMGGPMGVGDRGRIHWINDEIDYVANAVHDGVPVWGVCLGAQILAAALGAKIWQGSEAEVGIGKVALTDAGSRDPVWDGLGGVLDVMQWHSDTFELPAGAELLAESALYPHQLFRYKSSYGVQFHLEATPELAARWLEIPEYRSSLEAVLGEDGAHQFAAAHLTVEQALTATAKHVIRRWLTQFVTPRLSNVACRSDKSCRHRPHRISPTSTRTSCTQFTGGTS